MEVTLQNVVPLPEGSKKKADQSQLSADSKSQNISGKIQEMAKSLAEATVYSSSKPMQSLKQLKLDREQVEKQIEMSQSSMLQDLNSMQNSLLSFQRQKFFYHARCKIDQDQIRGSLKDFEIQLKKMGEEVHEKWSQYGDKISNAKISIVQGQSLGKQRLAKLERQTNYRLGVATMGISSNEVQIDKVRDSFGKRFKELRMQIQEESIEIEKQKVRSEMMLSQLRASLAGRVEGERIRQKECFQQNYKALEQIFKLLSEDIHDLQ